MKPSSWHAGFYITILLTLSVGALNAFPEEASLPAFPGAEGFGSTTPGGRGGVILIVDSLEDYQPGKEEAVPGTLRQACDMKGPRIIVFRTAGVIHLKKNLTIREPFITIAGQSAPGGGIVLADHALQVNDAHDVVIRYLRVRPGDIAGVELDAISISGSRNVVIDHCSASWGNDETLSVSGAGQDNITVQWCFITESLDQSVHSKGAHGYASLLRTDGRVTFHHNLYAHHRTRCPRPGTYGEEPGILLDFRNNVIYDWNKPAGYSAADSVRMNYAGNYLKPGPSTNSRTTAFSVGGDATWLYVNDNHMEGLEPHPDDPWALIEHADRAHRMATPYDSAPVRRDGPRQAFEKVLAGAGAALPVRDGVDQRIVEQVTNGTGRIINSQSDVGGWPVIQEAEPPADADNDGMPDAWETAHGLNPNDPADASEDPDGDGYTHIEEYLNQTDPNQPGGVQ